MMNPVKHNKSKGTGKKTSSIKRSPEEVQRDLLNPKFIVTHSDYLQDLFSDQLDSKNSTKEKIEAFKMLQYLFKFKYTHDESSGKLVQNIDVTLTSSSYVVRSIISIAGNIVKNARSVYVRSSNKDSYSSHKAALTESYIRKVLLAFYSLKSLN
jgi:hypothetical protein